MKICEFDIQICKENVLHLIDCYEESELYPEVLEEFTEMLPEVYACIKPAALLSFGNLQGLTYAGQEEGEQPALFCITSVGARISQWVTRLFEQGDYLKGMLADAMADDYLFQMDHQLADTVKYLCGAQGYGVSRRLEAPQDIPMEVQGRALAATEGTQLAGIHIKESFMYDPVKTTCQVYVLVKGSKEFHLQHDCSRCPNLTCKLRR